MAGGAKTCWDNITIQHHHMCCVTVLISHVAKLVYRKRWRRLNEPHQFYTRRKICIFLHCIETTSFG